eukprot:SAG11_NODE_3344_length_2509_cov_4.892946_1_plen_68_part_00
MTRFSDPLIMILRHTYYKIGTCGFGYNMICTHKNAPKRRIETNRLTLLARRTGYLRGGGSGAPPPPS